MVSSGSSKPDPPQAGAARLLVFAVIVGLLVFKANEELGRVMRLDRVKIPLNSSF